MSVQELANKRNLIETLIEEYNNEIGSAGFKLELNIESI